MAFGLYKPGQGYWMRVLTAAMLGTLFLATAMWVSQQSTRIAAKLPVSSYSVPVPPSVDASTITPGATVALLTEARGTTPPDVIGTAQIERFDADNRRVIISSTAVTHASHSIRDTRGLRFDNAATPYVVPSEIPLAQTVVEPVLVQGIAASIILIIGAVITYWFCAANTKSVDFLINTDMEMKKVNWSTRKDVVGSTWVVIGSAFLIAAFIFATDVIMKTVFQYIGILHG